MKTRALLAGTAAVFIFIAHSHGEKPIVVEASVIDTSIDPASVTYTARDKNIYGQPMEILVPKSFESDSGLIAVARRLVADNAKFLQVKMPVRIYSDDSAHRELAEYFHFGSIHDLRITGPELLVRKIVKLPKAESSASFPKKQTEQGNAPSGAPVDPSAVTYRIVEGPGTRLGHIIIAPKYASEAGLVAVAKRIDKDTAKFPVVGFEIYDNAKAEEIVSTGKLNDANEAFCHRHDLASYERNVNANINRLRLYEVVTGSAKKDIRFTTGEPTRGIFSHQ
jgi:hypothetical protein